VFASDLRGGALRWRNSLRHQLGDRRPRWHQLAVHRSNTGRSAFGAVSLTAAVDGHTSSDSPTLRYHNTEALKCLDSPSVRAQDGPLQAATTSVPIAGERMRAD